MHDVYHYTARSGEGQFVSGTMRARSEREAIAHLRTRRLFVTSLEAANGARGRVRALLMLRRTRRSSRSVFVRSLAALIAGGMPLHRALQVTIEQCKEERFAETLRSVTADVDAGASLSDALQRRPRDFSGHIVAMIRAGELGGVLDDVLARAATLLEREDALRKQIIAATAYPAFVSSSALGLIVFLMIVTVPAFTSILEQLHASLPLSTQIMISGSVLLRRPLSWAIIVAAVGTVIACLCALRGRDAVAAWIDRKILDLPAWGAMQRSTNIAAFTRTVGTLLQCGVLITNAVRTASDVVTNAAYRRATYELEHSLRAGMAFAPLLEQSGLFGPMVVQMVYVGEESGSLDAMLIRLAEHYEAEVSAGLAAVTAVLEPALILALGGVVGTIVASILVPLYGAIGSIH